MAALSLFSLLASANATNSGNLCDFRVQVAHVQDATTTFAEEITHLKEQNLVAALIEQLRENYGKVDYAITSFQDKPMPITGFGQTGGWWNEDTWFESFHEDQCYSMVQPLTSDAQAANDAFELIKAAGGKDFMENQWDALHRSAIDPTIGWDLRTHDDDGSPIVRIAILITDDAAHTAPTTFENNPRNANREYFKLEGPFNSFSSMGSSTQKCDLDASLDVENNIHTDWVNGGMCEQVSGEGGVCYGWSTSKAGVTRSLKGTMGYMNFYFGYGESPRLIDAVECPGGSGNDCWEYSAFVNCCTGWGVSTNRMCWDDHADRFPDYDSCVAYGGKYARCHASLDTKYGVANDWPQNRHNACTMETEEWLAAKNLEPSADFWKGLQISDESGRQEVIAKIKAIEDYPYDETIFDKDCRHFEYPDPKSDDYAKAFLERGIIPIIVAAPPSSKYKVFPGTDPKRMSSYDYHALRMSEHNCPGLEYDPWTSYFCQSAKPNAGWYCYLPHLYSDLFPNQEGWDTNVPGQRWYESELGCDDEHCAKKWWSSCMDVEYGEPIRALKDKGVSAYYQEMDAAFDATVIVEMMLDVIEVALEDKGCIIPPTLDPPTTQEAGNGLVTATRPSTTTEEPSTTEKPVTLPPVVPTNPPVVPTNPPDETTNGNFPTDLPVTPPTQPAEITEDSNVGVIVGSAIGGVAAAGGAVVAALMAKGIIPMGGKSAGEDVTEDVEVHDLPQEREQIAEISNMFA